MWNGAQTVGGSSVRCAWVLSASFASAEPTVQHERGDVIAADTVLSQSGSRHRQIPPSTTAVGPLRYDLQSAGLRAVCDERDESDIISVREKDDFMLDKSGGRDCD